MAAYLDSHAISVLIDAGWLDLTPNVVSDLRLVWGMGGNEVLDRIATVGTLTFELNNEYGQYSPNSGILPGWKKGAPVKVVLGFDGSSYVRFRGYIDELQPQAGTWGARRVKVRCVDWISIASNYPLVLPQAYANQRADQGVTLICDEMPIQPQARDFATTDDQFNQIFDAVKVKTKALTEFGKLTLSEFGYLYLRKDRNFGETLVVEGRHDRDAGITQSPIPVALAASGHVLMETGDRLLMETGDALLLDEITTYDFDRTMQVLEASYGRGLSNYVTVRTYPREVDTVAQVLFKANSPIALAAGVTKSGIRGGFVDPRGGGTRVNGNTMVAPVANTDYKMYQNQDGTGSDLTSALSVTAQYSTAEVVYTLRNTGGVGGYVTKLQARGFAVYIYDTIEQFVQDDTSILENGYQELTVEQRYSPTLLPNVDLATVLLAQEKDAHTEIQKITILGNTSYEHMASALSHDVGSLIKVIEQQTGINGSYFINRVEMVITPAGIVTATWVPVEAVSLSSQYWTLESPGFSELDQTTFVGF